MNKCPQQAEIPPRALAVQRRSTEQQEGDNERDDNIEELRQ